METFVAPQAQRVDRREIGPVAGFADGTEELSHLVETQTFAVQSCDFPIVL